MPTLNAAATLEQATDFANDFAGCTVVVYDGATVCATFTVPSWTPSNDTNDGLATAAAISDVTIAANGNPVDSARIISATGGREVMLSVGTSSAELNFTTLNFVAGETASISNLVVRFPA